jgi:hypothetical protein
LKTDEQVLILNEFKEKKFKGVLNSLAALMVNKQRQAQVVLGWQVKDITEGDKCKCQIQYRVYSFEVTEKSFNFIAALKITGIEALDALVTKLPEELRKVKLMGEVAVISKLHIEHNVKLEGKCKDITVDDVKKSLQYDLMVTLYKAALERVGTGQEKAEDLRTIFQAAAIFSLVGSLRP